jgi:hypothetical protein
MPRATGHAVSLSLALLAERDAPLRQRIAGVLRGVGYEVAESNSALQLKVRLFSSRLLAADDALLVLEQEIADQCVEELRALLRIRSRRIARDPAARFIFIAQGGASVSPAGLDRRQIAGVLWKPFELDDLRKLVDRGGLAV